MRFRDLFIFHPENYALVVGRLKEMIIRGGENIAPKEIERLLETMPGIKEVQVYGVASDRLGEEVGCSIRLEEGFTLTKDDVRGFCKGKVMPRSKI